MLASLGYPSFLPAAGIAMLYRPRVGIPPGLAALACLAVVLAPFASDEPLRGILALSLVTGWPVLVQIVLAPYGGRGRE